MKNQADSDKKVKDQSYTEKPVKGELPLKILPDGWSLVLEGGGTRGYYSAGVFEAFMDAGILFPYIVGVSAGAANAMSYISGQKTRNRSIVEKYVSKHEYLSIWNLVTRRSMFGYDFIFGEIPRKHIFFEEEIFHAVNIRFLTGAMNCRTGETAWFEKSEMTDGYEVLRASCSVPFVSPVVKYKGYELLDGGIDSPIPIDKSIADGNTFHVIILTRNIGYSKLPFKYKRFLRIWYRKYPLLIQGILRHHEIYNRELALCERLEREGKAIIIRPGFPLQMDMMGKNITELLALHDHGEADGKAAVEKIKERLQN